MGIFSALYAGVNGINANGNVISIIGDNIANVNTIGFKTSRATFEDILAGGNTGLGSRVSRVSASFSQGGFESSTSITDMAIDGKGFFVLRNSEDGSTFYTRAGQFSINKDGYIVNADNYRLRGFSVDSGVVTSNVDDILVSPEPVPPSASTEIVMNINLDANEVVPGAFNAQDPVATSNFSAGITIYDSLGNDHLVTIYFRKTSSNNWAWYGLVDGGEITGGSAGINEVEASGTLEFNPDGSLNDAVITTSDFDFIGATQSQAIAFDFGTDTDSGGTGLDGITQFGSDSSITNITQDGYTSGSLKSIELDSEGVISGNYTNGTSRILSQVSLATFASEQGLTRVGSNNYIETLESGQPVIGTPAAGGRGAIVQSTLEQSNVDLAEELIKMVVIQRGFQANSRTITTVNDLLAALVTLGQ